MIRKRKLQALAAGLFVSAMSPQLFAADPIKNVTVHLFEWKWNDIKEECAYLEEKGYAAVQVSPPNEHAVINNGNEQWPWWQRYQPVSYELTQSRSGSLAEFEDMVRTCWQDHGVKIYVDAVINHMASGSGTGSAGTSFSYPSYNIFNRNGASEWYGSYDFNGQCNIDYNNASSVRNCWITGGLPDLTSGTDYVRGQLTRFLNSMVDMGVAGFRLDAIKHMHPNDVNTIISQVNNLRSDNGWFESGLRPFVYQEVIGSDSEAENGGVSIDEYLNTVNGAQLQVTEFAYGTRMGEKFRWDQNGAISEFLKSDFPVASSGWGMVDSSFALVFTDNHDNQRGHGAGYWTGGGNNAIGGILTHFYDDSLYSLANVFMLSWPYGSPRVMSSYEWDRNVQWVDGQYKDVNDWKGPWADGSGNTFDADCNNGWICEHRWDAIAGMVGFNNYTQDAWNVGYEWHNDGNQIAFARTTSSGDSRGFVVINREGYDLNISLPTGMPADDYCDVVRGSFNFNTNACTGATVTVDASGNAYFTVPAYSASAIHIGAPADGVTTEECNFSSLYLRGTFNGWSSDAMTCLGDNVWEATDVVFTNGEGDPRFKFDKNADWSENYGDNNNDGIAEAFGDDIRVDANTTFTIRFNDASFVYEVIPEDAPPKECNFSSLYLRGTFNGWSSDAMTCLGDNVWEATDVVFANGEGDPRFKFDKNADWSENYGDNNNDGIAEAFGDDIRVDANMTFTIRFNDSSFVYEVIPDDVLPPPPPEEVVNVTFSCQNGTTNDNTSVYVVGNHELLGNWTVASSAQVLGADNYPTWTATIELPMNTSFEWKCVKADESSLSITQWQGGGNNTFSTGTGDTSVSASF